MDEETETTGTLYFILRISQKRHRFRNNKWIV